ncbi:hypothetical protein QTH90_14535 [Variovorax sp. J2P1-59]|uniref:hypothetical protein n=1 Tax=Variovorax flavidus TaxID=3053501 RepID=UPI002577C8FA|nr:hypothetical protein [Variovorax sp. J2P1-59]MDM0075617.1 hypothetical protein [Variovorax sp. J2P1-59]
MKYIKYPACFVLGLVISTAIFYGGLAAWASLFLDPNDSYFDREPRVADAVFMSWLIWTLLGGFFGAWLARRKS